MPLEQSAYFLPGPQGEVCGLLGAHVDDLLWCGDHRMEKVVHAIQEKYEFGIVQATEFNFCGRIINQTETGIKITSPNVMDRVKPIYIEPLRRKHRGLPATSAEQSQLRSVIGSLAWLARTCRPDLSFAVNQLQSKQQAARVEDLIHANKLLHKSLETKDKGIFYANKPFQFEEAILVSINDASHAASVEAVAEGQLSGHRSQSGRLLVLAPKDFMDTGKGTVHLLQWHSTTLRRVCRSTLQAETLSMQLGSEECEHVRQMLFAMKNNISDGTPSRDYQAALNHMDCLWLADCRSLSDFLLTPGKSEVNDKRLAIDLTSLRQEVWRAPNETVGNPIYTDSLPADRTTFVKWVATKSMVSDVLTKEMKPEQLNDLTEKGQLQVVYHVPHL